VVVDLCIDSQTSHQFQWINTTLTAPAVVLDQSSQISYSWSADSQTLSITFSSSEAFSTARSTWNTSTILIAYAEGCGNYAKGDSCYIAVNSLTFSPGTYSCSASGEVMTLKQCLVSMKASWGKYLPASSTSQTLRADFASGALSVWSSVLSKYVSSSSSGGGAGSTTLAYTPAGAAAGNGQWSAWNSVDSASGAGRATVTTSVVLASGNNQEIGSPSPGSGSPYRGASGTGYATSLITSASPPSSFAFSGPTQTSIPTSHGGYTGGAGYLNSTSGEPYGNGTSSNHSYGSGTITTPPMTTTTPPALSVVSSSLSSVFSSLSASNNGSSNATASTGNSTSPYVPTNGNSASTSNTTTSYNSTMSYNSTSPGSSMLFNSTSSSNNTAQSSNSTTYTASNCTKGTDPIFGLPTTCIGPNFDIDLDSIDGFLTLNQTDFAALVALFPGLVTQSTLANSKRGIELSKRCSWYDIICDAEEVYDYASSVVSSVASVVSTDYTSATSALEAAATDLANTIIDAAEAAGQEISDAAAEVIADLEEGLESLLNFQQSVSVPISVTPSDDALEDSPWGEQALLGSFGEGEKDEAESDSDEKAKRSEGEEAENEDEDGEGASFSMNVFCVNCAITGSVELEGELAVDMSGISALEVGATADLTLGLGIGLDAKAEYSHTFSVTLFQEGIPELCSGTTLCIGPYVKLAAELTFAAEAEGYLLVGGQWALTDATAQLYAYGGTSGATNWTPTFTPTLQAGGEITLSLSYGMPLSVGLGINILDDTISEDVELTITPSITATATAALNITSDGTTTTVDTSTGDCNGIDVSLDWEVDLTYNILNLAEGSIYDTGAMNIAETCIAWNSFVANGTDTANSSTEVGFGSGAGNVTSSYANVTLVDSSDGSALQICTNGDVYKVSPGFSAADCSPNWLAYTSLLSTTDSFSSSANSSSVVADASRRLPILFPEVMAKTNVSRLRLVQSGAIPSKAEYVAFDSFASGRLAVDRLGKQYTAVQCSNLNSTAGAGRNEVFLVSDASQGLAVLNADEVVYSISNGYVQNCVAMSLTMVVVT